MKIAQVSPLYESVPPKYYGGTERVVSYLTEKLVEMGHDVTLFASADSKTKARLIPVCDKALRLRPNYVIDPYSYHMLLSEIVFQCSDDFEVIHSHIDYFPFSLIRKTKTATVTTLHGRLDIPDIIPLYQEFSELSLVSISNSHRKPMPWVNWVGTVYHGLPVHLYQCQNKPKADHLVFLGRISPEKGVDMAIQIAIKAKKKLKIAAKVEKKDYDFYVNKVEPFLNHPLIEYIGEISEDQKNEFIGNAEALLFPIDWCEPFGMVMIEALACGTPVIARKRGSVSEIIEENISGYIFETLEEAVQAVQKIDLIDRNKCREYFEQRFTSDRMAMDYLKIYEACLHRSMNMNSGSA